MANELILMTGKNAASVDPTTGDILWKARLPFSTNAASVVVSGIQVFIGGSGKVCSLDVRTGALLWENSLPGFGYDFTALAMEGQPSGSGAAQVAAMAAKADGASGAAAG